MDIYASDLLSLCSETDFTDLISPQNLKKNNDVFLIVFGIEYKHKWTTCMWHQRDFHSVR